MNWTELLRYEMESTYAVADALMARVEENKLPLDWKPSTGKNWMTTGQLLGHLAQSCGVLVEGFVTGDWGMPPEHIADTPPEEMLTPAEKMASIESVAKARKLLAEDRKLALDVLANVGDERLANQKATAPWDPRELPLGVRLLAMVAHLSQHKGQLFYYMKLQNINVNSGDLWGEI